MGARVSAVYTGELGPGASDGGQKKEGTSAGRPWGAGALVSCGGCDRRSGHCFAQPAHATSKTAPMSVQSSLSEMYNGTRCLREALLLFVLWCKNKNKGGNGMAEQLMETTWRTALWRQFGAAIPMLENALLASPTPPAKDPPRS